MERAKGFKTFLRESFISSHFLSFKTYFFAKCITVCITLKPYINYSVKKAIVNGFYQKNGCFIVKKHLVHRKNIDLYAFLA